MTCAEYLCCRCGSKWEIQGPREEIKCPYCAGTDCKLLSLESRDDEPEDKEPA